MNNNNNFYKRKSKKVGIAEMIRNAWNKDGIKNYCV